ncbi:MAG: ribosomal-processing cysteine protease Prp [Armatimonadetes bacterium]|nr:ribosomal-processing cysteine protease Prp [Armatimonadota bacterium]
MISVRIARDSRGAIVGFEATGHAMEGPHGRDIVCASVSALLQSAVWGLEEHLDLRLRLETDQGRLSCRLSPGRDQARGKEAAAILETMVLGLSRIEEQYPGRLSMATVRSSEISSIRRKTHGRDYNRRRSVRRRKE